MIIPSNPLNSEQFDQLNALHALCQKMDSGAPAIYSHLLMEKRPTDSTLLYYNNKQLIGFLSVYFFYDAGCEISVLVHPNYRRQQIASQLLRQILPLLTTKAIQQVIFSTSKCFSWLSQRGFRLIESEYYMERMSAIPVPLVTPVLTIKKATPVDIPALIAIDAQSFSQTEKHPPEHFTGLLNNPLYTLLIADYQNKPIGKVHIRWQDETLTFLSDIAILPDFQGRGLGRELVAYAINVVLMQGKTKIALNVTHNNPSNALNLYLHHDFKITSECDYWAVLLDELRSLIRDGEINNIPT